MSVGANSREGAAPRGTAPPEAQPHGEQRFRSGLGPLWLWICHYVVAVARARAPEPRWLKIEERDLDFRLDKDGCPTANWRTWRIAVSSITAVEVEPEGNGERVTLHVRGVKRPIVVCDGSEYVLKQIGLTP